MIRKPEEVEMKSRQLNLQNAIDGVLSKEKDYNVIVPVLVKLVDREINHVLKIIREDRNV
jgi:hypothetical protein